MGLFKRTFAELCYPTLECDLRLLWLHFYRLFYFSRFSDSEFIEKPWFCENNRFSSVHELNNRINCSYMILETKTSVQKNISKCPSQTSLLIREIQLDPDNNKRFERLCYCGQGCTRIPDALVKLYGPKVQSLDLSYNELVSLKGLEAFVDLRELVLDNNQLSDSLVLPNLANLHTLSLNKNLICNLESLLVQIKKQLPALSYLSLLGNRACPNQLTSKENDDEDYQRYRYFVLHHLPNLKFLDSNKVTQEERMQAKHRGKYMNIITPSTSLGGQVDVDVNVNRMNIRGNLKYSPLPLSLRKPDDYKGAYGKCRYRYSGKHSEGNRFISNKDL